MSPVDDLPLFANPLDPPFLTNPVTDLERDFAAFHRAHPHIYKALEERALRELAAGTRRIGSKKLVEDLRYDPSIARGDARFKVSNSHTSFYARLLIHYNSALATLIPVRTQTHYTKEAAA